MEQKDAAKWMTIGLAVIGLVADVFSILSFIGIQGVRSSFSLPILSVEIDRTSFLLIAGVTIFYGLVVCSTVLLVIIRKRPAPPESYWLPWAIFFHLVAAPMYVLYLRLLDPRLGVGGSAMLAIMFGLPVSAAFYALGKGLLPYFAGQSKVLVRLRKTYGSKEWGELRGRFAKGEGIVHPKDWTSYRGHLCQHCGLPLAPVGISESGKGDFLFACDHCRQLYAIKTRPLEMSD